MSELIKLNHSRLLALNKLRVNKPQYNINAYLDTVFRYEWSQSSIQELIDAIDKFKNMTYVKERGFIFGPYGLAHKSLDCFSFVLSVFSYLSNENPQKFRYLISYRSKIPMVDFLVHALKENYIEPLINASQIVTKKAGLIIILKWHNNNPKWQSLEPSSLGEKPSRHLMLFYVNSDKNVVEIWHNTSKTKGVSKIEIPLESSPTNNQLKLQKWINNKWKVGRFDDISGHNTIEPRLYI